jgi:hypothetical protein
MVFSGLVIAKAIQNKRIIGFSNLVRFSFEGTSMIDRPARAHALSLSITG